MMHKQNYRKPDGRILHLYSRTPLDPEIQAPSPSSTPVSVGGAHMRFHPLRGEWVAYAGHRQNRTFLPPKEFNPLAPMRDPAFPTELPDANYEVAVFENMFPTLSPLATDPPHIPGVKTMPALGACEVVVFARDSDTSLSRLSVDHVSLILEVWADRYRELGARDDIQYVMPFENKGVEVGVTLHHPHGQIYAYSSVPPVPARMQENEKAYFEVEGRPLLSDFIERERREGVRMIYEGDSAVAFVPACARYPYEVWVAPKRALSSIAELLDHERMDLARALKTVVMKYDALWQKPFPYLMVAYQAPTDGQVHPETHFHFEFFPPYRTRDRLKYLAGTELGAGLFANDAFPEEKARELQAVVIDQEGLR